MMRLRRAVFAASLVSALLAGGSRLPAAAAQASGARALAACTEKAGAEVFHEGGVPLLDWKENLEFDGRGTLWVAHLTKNRVEGYAPDGTLKASVPVSGPGGIRRGPDGMMYVNYGVNPLSSWATGGGIVRFDPTAAAPKAETFVDGLSGVNGLVIDSVGNLYVSRELATGILKIRPDGTKDEKWTRAADVFGTNGLEIVGDQLYASVITDTASPVVRVPLNDPAARTTVVELSPNPLKTKVLDDLTAFEGTLVVASFRDGELLQVDPATGRSCVLVSGLRMPTSVRVPRGFGDHDGRRELFVSEASGRVVKVTVG
ncbi:SMP-30/gluconolactonase/LRE family protein [Streptomyces sp. NPDC020379]|uniref:SMP-30/gluconolactonase/LRE family protein n=1 Tax=Streptomyces sp. NPDC020379 TaxID=3365071 RepID=UPI0037B31FD0